MGSLSIASSPDFRFFPSHLYICACEGTSPLPLWLWVEYRLYVLCASRHSDEASLCAFSPGQLEWHCLFYWGSLFRHSRAWCACRCVGVRISCATMLPLAQRIADATADASECGFCVWVGTHCSCQR
jgi:hypothetical protein